MPAEVALGDPIPDPSPEIRLLMELPSDFIPDDARKLSRDLFGDLLILESTQWPDRSRTGSANDSYGLLYGIQALARQGYFETSALIRHVEENYPRSDVAHRLVRSCRELAGKNSAYLFLPIVARIVRHQAYPSVADSSLCRLIDASVVRQDPGIHAAFAQRLVEHAPCTAERSAIAFASMLAGKKSAPGDDEAHLHAIADMLRGLAAGTPSELPEGLSDDSASVIDIVCVHGPWIWLEALFVVENRIAGLHGSDKALVVA